MVQSELDDIPGIGEVKTKALLQKFKSVENIKKASVEELMQVKGINENLANQLKLM